MRSVLQITIRRSTSTDLCFEQFCDALDSEFRSRYPSEEQDFKPYNTVDGNARVVLAYHDTLPVGCGCFRPADDDSVEIKRMYVIPTHRGRQIAAGILETLEKWAVEEGYSAAKLETGIGQPEARALYLRHGYYEIPNYPPYCDVDLSICMQKKLR